MPKLSYGPAAKQRTLSLLLALLDYGNDELVVADEAALERLRSQLTLHWATDRQLIVRTRIRNLETLTRLSTQPLTPDQIKVALHHLEHHLGLLEDNRTSRRGSDTWHFTLHLWHHRRDRAAIVTRFEEIWEQQRSDASKRQTSEDASPDTDPNPISEEWQPLCRQALGTAAHHALTSNALTAPAGLCFDLTDLYVPLNLVARSPDPRTTEDETTQPISSTQLFEAIQQQDIRHLAIVGDPGAGKTTLLQQLALWVLDHTPDLPILVPLAHVGDTCSAQASQRPLEDYLLQDWLKLSLGKRTVPAATQEALTDHIEAGRVWLLLDAVDEMTVANSLTLTTLARQMAGWLRHARIVVTCRLSLWDGGKNALATLPTYRLLGYESDRHQREDQMKTVIRRWFQANPDQGEQLCRQLARPEYKRLCSTLRNPLRLALLCRIGGQGHLPNTQHQLYQQFVTALYDWKQDYFPTSLVERQHLNRLLARLALAALTRSLFQLPLSLITQTLALEDLERLDQAIRLGWLTPIANPTGEKVYRFAHSTFQDYFAAQAVDRWQLFTTPQGDVLPIASPAWQAVILLWLGRDDISDADKTALMHYLVTFEDGCGGFFRDRTQLLAGRALAEYPSFAAGDQIVETLVRWRLNIGNQVPPVLIEGAKSALAESDQSRVIKALTNVAQDSTQSLFSRWMAAYSLGRSYEPESGVAIATLSDLLPHVRPLDLKMDLARHLGILAPEHPDAVKTLVEIIQTAPHPTTQRKAALRLAKIAPHHPLPIATFERILKGAPSTQLQRSTIAALKEIAPDHPLLPVEPATPSNQAAFKQRKSSRSPARGYPPDTQTRIEKILELLQTAPKTNIRLNLARQLGQLQPGHPQAIAIFLEYLRAPEPLSMLKSVCDTLRDCLTREQIPEMVARLKFLYEEAAAAGHQPCKLAYFKLLWEWADELGYPQFHGHWHSQQQGNIALRAKV
ncbi:MAG: NACHT domain-containing protein [Synechococcales bacterium]|nr:NACHT domain-containing protein [Synechococcales bacterium]